MPRAGDKERPMATGVTKGGSPLRSAFLALERLLQIGHTIQPPAHSRIAEQLLRFDQPGV